MTALDDVIDAAHARGGFYSGKGALSERCQFVVEAFGRGRFIVTTGCDEAVSNAWPVISIDWAGGNAETGERVPDDVAFGVLFEMLQAAIASSQNAIITRPEPVDPD